MAQFYATLHISECGRIFQFLIGGKRFTYTMAQFSILFGHTGNQVGYGGRYIVDRDESKVDLHEGNELDPSKVGKSRASLHFIDCSTLCFISLSLLEGVTRTTSHIGPRTC